MNRRTDKRFWQRYQRLAQSGMWAVLAALPLCASAAVGVINDKESLENTRFVETEASRALDNYQEAAYTLPEFPRQDTAKWFDIYAGETFNRTVQIDLNSLSLGSDRTVRYVLNERSQNGIDNVTVEAMYCSPTSFYQTKESSYKIYAYGDTVNHRWIEARRGQWRDIGPIHQAEAVHGALYRVFCEDGLPHNQEELMQRVYERGGRSPIAR